ncbi:MAG: hypothetical protein FH748_14110 [Balneolaceae bacterium]|nr:hypothetical protein [Balneolaceae bacterium]
MISVVLTISFTTDANQLSIGGKDNGLGMDTENTLSKASGNGLKNIQNRAQEMNGDCTINSSPNNGTEFLLSIPLIP